MLLQATVILVVFVIFILFTDQKQKVLNCSLALYLFDIRKIKAQKPVKKCFVVLRTQQ